MIETIQKLTPKQREVLNAIAKGQRMSSQWETVTLNRLLRAKLITAHELSVYDATGIVAETMMEFRLAGDGVKEALAKIEEMERQKAENAVVPF